MTPAGVTVYASIYVILIYQLLRGHGMEDCMFIIMNYNYNNNLIFI